MNAVLWHCRRVILLALLLAAFGGCHAGWSRLSDPARDQIVRVTSGDTILFQLEEDSGAGYRWGYTCDDSDVAVVVEHDRPAAPGEKGVAKVTIHVHRGYDGPSSIRFSCKRPSDRRPVQEFTHMLYRRTGDVAFWE